MNTKLRGDYGEKLAAAFLVQKGYTILGRNFRVGGGELDIIARGPHGELVFVEVKLRASDSFGHGEESIGRMKLKRMRQAIGRYLEEQAVALRRRRTTYQIDIIEITTQRGGTTISHIKDIEL